MLILIELYVYNSISALHIKLNRDHILLAKFSTDHIMGSFMNALTFTCIGLDVAIITDILLQGKPWKV